jgi:hypothetical protein
MKMIRWCLMGGLAAGSMFAADVTGKWECGVKGGDGVMRPLIATLKADGSKVTGSLNGINSPDIDIFDGKVEGNQISWSSKRPVQGGTVQFNYSGTIAGDELQLKIVRADGQGVAMGCTAMRSK